MYLGQHNHSAAISLFMESLHHGYSLVPPDQLLNSICEAMEKTKATYNLYTVVKLLMERGISVCKKYDLVPLSVTHPIDPESNKRQAL